ncbi:hypothetical protein ACMFMG_008415 [Clarireedia jacksonii]
MYQSRETLIDYLRGRNKQDSLAPLLLDLSFMETRNITNSKKQRYIISIRRNFALDEKEPARMLYHASQCKAPNTCKHCSCCIGTGVVVFSRLDYERLAYFDTQQRR